MVFPLTGVNKDSKKLEYRDLTGPDKLLVMQSINFQSLLPNFKQTKEVEKLWASFMEIIGDLKLEFTTDDAITQLTNNHGLISLYACIKPKMLPHTCMHYMLIV